MKRTAGFSGAELESIVKEACSSAMDRCIDMNDLSVPMNESKLKLLFKDFYEALEMVEASRVI